MADIGWTFGKTGCGRDSGLHDAGVETFKGDFDRYLAREMIQNSLDARHDLNTPAIVKFELLSLETKDIPDNDCLKATLERCAEYWVHDKKAKSFFARAVALCGANKIAALRIGDSNTTGVLGSDTDRLKNWYNLIRCAGSSSKGGGEGGSFGIGKNAPFAASQLRTVLYSTFNTDEEHIFQGVSTLVSHIHPTGGIAQATGYLGGEEGSSIRSKNKIPKKFIRTEHGTDLIVLGFPASASWQKDLVYSVLDNFWPAIHFAELEVQVGDILIKKDNLQPLLEQYSAEEGFTAHLYYQAFTKSTHKFPASLHLLKDSTLYLFAGDHELPKKIAMVRKTGMKIYEKPFRSMIPFCGVFMCRNETGNKLLREMEPPRHDTWDPDHPEKGANRKVESEYVNFIRDCIRKLTPIDESKVISIPGLNRFLPDDNETPEESFGDTNQEDSKQENANRKQLPEKIPGRKMDSKAKPTQPDHQNPDDEDNQAGSTSGSNSGNGGTNKNETKNGNGSPNEATNSQAGGGSEGGENPKPSVPIKYRTFAQDTATGVYTVTVTGEQKADIDAILVISIIGDDQKLAAELKSARLASGTSIPILNGGNVGPLKLAAGKTLRLEVVLTEPLRVAMEIAAHEA